MNLLRFSYSTALRRGAALLLFVPVVFTGCTTTDSGSGGGSGGGGGSLVPQVTHDGLVLLPDSDANRVWALPGADMSVYHRFALLEPEISFRKNWQDDINASRAPTDRISSRDMERMIERGKELFTEEFNRELKDGGWKVSEVTGDDVLLIRPIIMNLDILAPDPDNMAGMWSRTYTDGAGAATLVIELYDSISKQILARAVDHKSDANMGGNWAIQRTQQTNINDARLAFSGWARMFVRGMEQTNVIPEELKPTSGG